MAQSAFMTTNALFYNVRSQRAMASWMLLGVQGIIPWLPEASFEETVIKNLGCHNVWGAPWPKAMRCPWGRALPPG